MTNHRGRVRVAARRAHIPEVPVRPRCPHPAVAVQHPETTPRSVKGRAVRISGESPASRPAKAGNTPIHRSASARLLLALPLFRGSRRLPVSDNRRSSIGVVR